MMITHTKKKKTTVNDNPQTSNVGYSFDGLPLDLVIEIIGRLPVKAVARFLLVSKLWAKIIRSQHFVKSFPFGSCSSRPRFLIAFYASDRKRGYYGRGTRLSNPRTETWYFFSSSFLSRSCPLPFLDHKIMQRSHYVNGLLSIGCGQQQFIVNPTTGKSIALPRVRTRTCIVRNFFGYDSVNDQYKVLCMTQKLYGPLQEPWSQHQVFTLGGEQKSWRMIECSIPHRPCSNGVCIHGVVYYVAETDTGESQRSVMRFDLRSEKFDLITGVSAEIGAKELYGHLFIFNFEGKVAIPIKTSMYTFDVWVMDKDAAEHIWLKKLTFSTEPWKSSNIKGITQTGEFILAPTFYNSDDVYVVHYNYKTGSFRKTKVEGDTDHHFKHLGLGQFVFSDYVESVRFL